MVKSQNLPGIQPVFSGSIALRQTLVIAVSLSA